MKPLLWESKEVISGSLEDRLRSKGRQLSSTLAHSTKRKRESLLEKSFIIDVKVQDIVPISEILSTMDHLRSDLNEKDEIIKGMIFQLNQFTYSGLENKGKAIDSVEERQKRRKITAIKEASKKALWFLDSFNVNVMDIILKTKTTEEVITLNYSSDQAQNKSQCQTTPLASHQSTLTTSHPNTYLDNELSAEINQILFLLDSFGVSDEFYHELSMCHSSLPRSYLIKEKRKSISSNVMIHRLPRPYFGCYRKLTTLMEEVLSRIETTITSPFHRSTSYILLSFSFPMVDDAASLSANGNHTFAILSGNENYMILKEGFAPVLVEINDLINRPVLKLNDKIVDLSIILGGDYKFLLMIMGLNAANAVHACLYCTIKKDERHNTALVPKIRTLDSLHQCARKKSQGVIHPPLLNIDLNYVVIDELHLLLRISDILIKNLVKAALALDIHISKDVTIHRDTLLEKIKGCGITFRIWKSKDTKEYEWTSLRGNDRKKLLLKLPQVIPLVIPGDDGLKIKKLWKDFNDIYSIISEKSPTSEQISSVERMAVQWIKDFIAIKFDGHSKGNVTPYMHLLACHIPSQMRRHSGFKPFSGQGVEKNNDCARRNYQSSNHMYAPREVITTEARLEFLSDRKGRKRNYTKRNQKYWSEDIIHKKTKNRLITL